MDLNILKNSSAAEFLEAWQKKYQRQFELTNVEDQANFYEGMLELARFVAKNSTNATISFLPCPSGISEITLKVTPNS